MSLSPARLAVIVALVVGGLAVMLNGFGEDETALAGDGTTATPTMTVSPSPSVEASPTATGSPTAQLEPRVEGVVIQVLNGTSVTGLAGAVQELLEGKGYDIGLPADDLQNKPATVSTVYFRGGADAAQNEADARHLARRFLEGVDAEVRPLSAQVSTGIAPKTQLVVVVGTDYAEANPI